jgi:hypothetical protein
MPYQVEQLLEGKGPLVWVTKDDTVLRTLSLMLEYDYSQLPVLTIFEEKYETVEGMVTYEGIIRGIRNFNLGIDKLKVRDVMGKAFTCSRDEDLFDILDRLKETYAALVVHEDLPVVIGIITSYDTTEYFRVRTEDLMRVEEIETTIRGLIQEAYTTIQAYGEDDIVDQEHLDAAARAVSYGKPKVFNQLSFPEYINLLTYPKTWGFFEAILNLPSEPVKNLLNNIRETRNLLAHFRGDLSTEERDQLRFAVEWITRCQDDYQTLKEKKKLELLKEKVKILDSEKTITDKNKLEIAAEKTSGYSGEYEVTESTKSGGRYTALADWLQSQAGSIDQVPLTFEEVEKIIGSNLPDSARVFRGWWANDSVGHSHSQLWLEAGWRTTYINLTEGKVTFSRIREREKAYIAFFSKLQDELRKHSKYPIKDLSPDGTSWLVLQTIPRGKTATGQFVCSFTRDKRFRIELYLDLRDKELTKRVFDKLYEQKATFEAQLGSIEWERLDSKRASRIAIYRNGHITEEEKQDEMRHWAVETFNRFYAALLEPAEKAILEVWVG